MLPMADTQSFLSTAIALESGPFSTQSTEHHAMILIKYISVYCAK